MKNLKNKRTIILAIILLGLLIVAYKTIFMSSDDNAPMPIDVNIPVTNDISPVGAVSDVNTAVANVSAGGNVESILREIENINFDTSVLEDQKFKSLKSIEIPLISLPIGRKNPFSAVSGSN